MIFKYWLGLLCLGWRLAYCINNKVMERDTGLRDRFQDPGNSNYDLIARNSKIGSEELLSGVLL